jgi:hypothetical protein
LEEFGHFTQNICIWSRWQVQATISGAASIEILYFKNYLRTRSNKEVGSNLLFESVVRTYVIRICCSNLLFEFVVRIYILFELVV